MPLIPILIVAGIGLTSWGVKEASDSMADVDDAAKAVGDMLLKASVFTGVCVAGYAAYRVFK